MYRVFFTTLALSLGRTEAYMILANVEIWNLVKEKPNKVNVMVLKIDDRGHI
jgi:hypothetical protein